MTTADAAGNSSISLPARGRPKEAPHFAVAWKVGTILRPEGEVLAVAGFKPRGDAELVLHRSGGPDCVRNREPVVRVRPRPGLIWVFAGRLDPRGQRRELVAAALADDREWLLVPSQLKRQLVRPAEAVTAWNGRYAQQRTVYAS